MMGQTIKVTNGLYKKCGIPVGIAAERMKEDWYTDPRNKKMIISALRRLGMPSCAIMAAMGLSENEYKSILLVNASVNSQINIDGEMPNLNWYKRPNISMGELIYFNQVLRMRPQEVARLFKITIKEVKALYRAYNIPYVTSNRKYASARIAQRSIKKIVARLAELKERSLVR